MGRRFNQPFVKPIEDKIVGGVLTFKQLLYLVSIIVVFSLLFLYSSNTVVVGEIKQVRWFFVIFKLIVLIIYGIFAVSFAFVKIHEMDLDSYLKELLKFHFKNKTITYKK